MLQTDSTETKHSQQHGVQLIEQHHEEMRQPYQVLHELPRDATPAQQDSAIQATFQPKEIRYSDRPDTLHLPGYGKGKSALEITTLPKYYRESFFAYSANGFAKYILQGFHSLMDRTEVS